MTPNPLTRLRVLKNDSRNLPPAVRRHASAQPLRGLQVDTGPGAAPGAGGLAPHAFGDDRSVAGFRTARFTRERSHTPADGRAARRADHRAWPRARRRRQARTPGAG